MDDLGIAAAGFEPEIVVSLQHQHLAAGPGEAAPDGEPQQPGADDGHIDGFAPAA